MLVTYWAVDFTLLFEYPYFFGGQKFGGEFGYRQRLGGLSAVHNSHVADRSGLVNLSPRVITYLLCTLWQPFTNAHD